MPDPGEGCGPYHPDSRLLPGNWQLRQAAVSRDNHDTISMVAIDSHGHLASGSSSNGLDAQVISRLCLQLYVSHSLSLAAWSLILQSFAAGRAVLAPGCMMEPSPLALLDGLAVKG